MCTLGDKILNTSLPRVQTLDALLTPPFQSFRNVTTVDGVNPLQVRDEWRREGEYYTGCIGCGKRAHVFGSKLRSSRRRFTMSRVVIEIVGSSRTDRLPEDWRLHVTTFLYGNKKIVINIIRKQRYCLTG